MSKIVTCFSFFRNGYVNYAAPKFGATLEGRANPFGEVDTLDGQHFAYAKKADAEKRVPPSAKIAAVPPVQPWAKVNAYE